MENGTHNVTRVCAVLHEMSIFSAVLPTVSMQGVALDHTSCSTFHVLLISCVKRSTTSIRHNFSYGKPAVMNDSVLLCQDLTHPNDPTRLTCMYSAQDLMSSAFIKECYKSNVVQHVAVCSWQFRKANEDHSDPNGPQKASVTMCVIFDY